MFNEYSIFSDANRDTIGCVIYDSENKRIKEYKKRAKFKNVSFNEADAIRYAMKKVFKKFKFYNEDIIDVCLTFYTDNTNAKKAVESVIFDICSPPDKDRFDVNDIQITPVLNKVKKYAEKIQETIDIRIAYSPAHCETREEAEDRFLDMNSKDVVTDYLNLDKKERKEMIKFLMKGNKIVDSFIKGL